VLAWHDATFSQHDWVLPRLLLPHPDTNTRAAVFAAALLGGKVLPGMAALSGSLVAPAASAARPELAGLARVGELLQALQAQQVGAAGATGFVIHCFVIHCFVIHCLQGLCIHWARRVCCSEQSSLQPALRGRHLQKHVAYICGPAVARCLLQVFSRARLAAVWAQDASYLKQHLSLWLHKQQRHVLDSLWPQLLAEAAAAPQKRPKKSSFQRLW
jgi:hypothetical protein